MQNANNILLIGFSFMQDLSKQKKQEGIKENIDPAQALPNYRKFLLRLE